VMDCRASLAETEKARHDGHCDGRVRYKTEFQKISTQDLFT